MGHIASDGLPSGQTPDARAAAQNRSEQQGTIQFMGPQAETLDRLLGRTEVELGAAQSRRGWSLFSVLRAAYRTLASDSNH
jgi:hypothetical protein